MNDALVMPPGRNYEIIANREAERSATPLGEQPEFETYCNFADSAIVVCRERIVLHVGRRAGKCGENRIWKRRKAVVLVRQAQFAGNSAVRMSIGLKCAIKTEPVGKAVAQTHSNLKHRDAAGHAS